MLAGSTEPVFCFEQFVDIYSCLLCRYVDCVRIKRILKSCTLSSFPSSVKVKGGWNTWIVGLNAITGWSKQWHSGRYSAFMVSYPDGIGKSHFMLRLLLFTQQNVHDILY